MLVCYSHIIYIFLTMTTQIKEKLKKILLMNVVPTVTA